MLEDAANHDIPPTKNENAFAGHAQRSLSKRPEEKRLVLKLDLILMPLCCLIYFVAYLDRNCIGNARLMGLEEDLSLTPNQFYNCLTMFFVGYIICMFPGNVGLRLPWMTAPALIGGGVLTFGAFCAGIGGAQNYATVLVLRVLIGCAQAFIQGLGLYLSFWYKRNELASRSAVFYSAATIAGAFSGLISYGISKHLTLERTGLSPWRWLFIVEGVLAVAVGITVILVIPNFADRMKKLKTWLLSEAELKLAIERSKDYNTTGANIDMWQVWACFKDPKSWMFAIINAGVALGIASVGNFLPTFVKSFGYSADKAQLFTVIPYACAAVFLIAICFLSDRYNMKGPLLVVTLSVSVIGYIILLSVRSVPVLVFATCLITAGLYPSVILLTSWLGINTCGFTKRGTTWAMAEVFGQCFSIMGTHVYDSPPRFIKGHAIVLGFLSMAIIMTVSAVFWMKHENKRKDAEIERYRDSGEHHPHFERSLEDEGDQHIAFRYIL
ncbi:uncharacterized protein Z520_03989 [Fonsecaea multimorphosa CBS 102226]|uniref:Major facilitator superfamily (MFS) profile domain-containing protein n=1 Tax=Fonsecaea multimorphosa CBS 102226 TaxID=1442371 RepID=A0A0D2KU79_9EURO|nr:uncharacterized protein Z520_03989 [Fonsecaea multimorphosa CBS 102226]KIY00304.1 hypothetical protein Z520_03989 [Fonsecaea multimorphosa CBS 102226]